MITLLLGPYGHGKSTYIIDRIKADYEHRVRSFLIVPEQQTLISERQLIKALPPAAQLYTEATNLTRLANSVFRKTGGLKYNYITKSGKNLIMYRTLCEVRPLLQQYKIPVGREKSCIKLFLQAIGELKSYGVEIPRLENATSQVENQDLKRKLEDIITVWSTYEALLREQYDDPYDDLLMLEKKLGECAFFKDCNVYIDSFYGFTKSQLDVILRIIDGAENVTIALDCPHTANESTMQYMKIAGTKEKIIAICKKLNKGFTVIPFDTDYKHESEEIKFVSKNLWSFECEPSPYCGDVTLALADDEFTECEYVCARIKELIRQNERYSDIAIIARNTATYQGIIDFSLDKYDIPYYFSVPAKITSKPLIKMVISALKSINGMRGEDIISYAKCGYTDIGTEELCLLESYIYKWDIYGKKFKNDDYWSANPDGYVQSPTITQLEELSIIQKTREQILKMLSILEKPFICGLSVKDCAVAVYDFLQAHNVKEKINREIAAETSEGAQELSQVWGALIGALDLVVDICGDTKCDVDTFVALLSYALMDAKVGSIPTGEDKVTIADASLVRAKNIRHVFVLGANEGSFPALVSDDSFFNDRDKIELETLEIDLSAKTDERGDDELLFFKNSIAAASHSVTVTALKTDINGQKKEPSIGFTRLKSLLDGISVVDISTLPLTDKIHTVKMARELYSAADCNTRAAIKELTGECLDTATFVNDSDTVSTDTANELFGKRLYLSKSKLEKFAKCRFDYYCSYILNLRDSEKIKFTHNDIGTLVHAIFEHFLKEYKENPRDYSEEEILDTVTRLTDEYTAQVCGARALSNKMKHFFNRLKSTSCVFVSTLLNEMKSSKFTPEYFELTINGDGQNSPLPQEFMIDDSNAIIMTGVADRIDVCRTDNTTYIKIFDYKTGNYDFKLSHIEKGLDMQMLIYLLALCNMKDSKFKQEVLKWTEKIEPAGIVYLSYKINKTDSDKEVDLSSEAALENEGIAIAEKVNRCGLELDNEELLSKDDKYNLPKKSTFRADDFETIFELVKTVISFIGLNMLSGGAQAQPLEGEDPCRYCKNGAICRRRLAK
ncbi:MAG: hypothetical protein E7596_05285 [Ruminococcaceae bacterium]|nr:hypothetical protein [Oscillospiraceae bacterium]